MITLLEQTLRSSHDWAIDRIHILCDRNDECDNENAYAIQCEFSEWLDVDISEHDIISLNYLPDGVN